MTTSAARDTTIAAGKIATRNDDATRTGPNKAVFRIRALEVVSPSHRCPDGTDRRGFYEMPVKAGRSGSRSIPPDPAAGEAPGFG